MALLELLSSIQLNMMLMLSGICAILTLFVLITKTISPKRKTALLLMEISAMLILMFDRYAYIYRGDASEFGYWMVRISNFAVFSLSLSVLFGFNLYLIDLYKNEGGVKKLPTRLVIAPAVLAFGELMIIINLFTGRYYTFDENNVYTRNSGFIVCYVLSWS